ncbi:MAG TPA: hypothetical protein VGM03_05270 [Phycisphaerae bacterium]|jgi:hypothetical protein
MRADSLSAAGGSRVGGEKAHVTLQRFILSIGLMLAATSAARADLHLGVPIDAQSGAKVAATLPATGSGVALPADLTMPVSAQSPQPTTYTLNLPGTPGSATLFLSAVLSVGALRVLRSAKDLHIGALPEWYHTGGPQQIGHTVAFDLDFGAFLPCSFEQPVSARPSFRRTYDSPLRCIAQCVRTITAPRGPPTAP